MNVAHIINRPGHEVGDKALALCGEEHKVQIKWEDLDDDHPVCHACVGVALEGLSDVTNAMALAAKRALLVLETLTDPRPITDAVDAQREYTFKQEVKAIEKAERKQAKKDAKKAKKAEVEQVPVAPPLPSDISNEEVDAFFNGLSQAEKRAMIERVIETTLPDSEPKATPGSVQRTEK